MKIKKMKRRSILTIIAILIFCSTFLLDYICKENKLVYRHWLSLSIIYYRYTFIIILFIILPFYLIIKKKNIWLRLLGFPIVVFIAFVLLITMDFNRTLATDSYYTEIDGKRVIALEERLWGDVTTLYYTPVNTFFMKKSNIPYPYEP